MHRILVDEKRWIDDTRFLQGLNFCMLLPGPEAQQLATYIGWRLNGIAGAAAAGLLFIAPGALVIFALSALYVAFRDLPAIDGVFLGVRAAVIAVVVEALLRVSKRALKSRAAVAVAGAAFVAIFAFQAPFPLIIAAAALTGLLAARAGRVWFAAPTVAVAAAPDVSLRAGLTAAAVCAALWAAPVAALLIFAGPDHIFTTQAIFFSKMAVVTFGGAYAVLAYVAQQAVETFGWLAPGEMIDGLGLAETTPGPLVLVLQFVGFVGAAKAETGLPPLVAGLIGGAIALWMTFAPCFLWIFLGGPFIDRLSRAKAAASALAAVTAAVVGVILNLTVWFAAHALFAEVGEARAGALVVLAPDPASFHWPSAVIAAAALVAVFRFHVGVLVLIAASAAAGIAMTYFL